jgi:hypothetical protein
MSQMSDDIDAAMVDLWTFAADLGIFIPDGGAPVELYVKIDKQENIEPDGFQTAAVSSELKAKALISELGQEPVGKTPNRTGDKFTVNNTTYEIISLVEQDNHFYTCAVREL